MQKKNALDYFSGGMAMPNRQIINGEPYRYGYQGEFAETDPETGKPAFELRLYDPRINRWLSPDPKGEFHSPYLAMGNNWANVVDPDGGCTTCPDDAKIGDTHVGDQGGNWTYSEDGWNTNDFDAYEVDLTQGGGFIPQITMDKSYVTALKYANSGVSIGIGSKLDNINYSGLLKTPQGSIMTNFNGSNVIWKDGFYGNGSVSSNTVKQAKLDFVKNLESGKNLTRIKGVTSALGYGLTAVSVALDTQSYMNGEISGHRYSWRMGSTGIATGAGYFLGTGPGLMFGAAAMAAEKGYDVFVDPKGPVWSNYGSWIPTSAAGIMQGFGGM